VVRTSRSTCASGVTLTCTVAIQLRSSSANTLATAPVVHVQSAAFAFTPTEGPEAGDILFHVALPMEGLEYQRFVGIATVVTGDDIEEGAISAFLTLDPHAYKHYPQGQVASPSDGGS
jgi:hypothetical protein